MTTDAINSYLFDRAQSFKIIFEDSYLTYDGGKKLLIAQYQYPYNSYQKIYEYYTVSVCNGKLKFTIENSKIE